MTEEEIKILQEENEALKSSKQELETKLATLTTEHDTLKASKAELDKKYLEVLEDNRRIVTNGAPLPDGEEADVDKKFAELFKNIT